MFVDDLNEAPAPDDFEQQDVASLMAHKEKIDTLIAARANDEVCAIEQQIAELNIRREKLIAMYGTPKKVKKPRSAGVIKFRHPENGKTWTGKGKPPQWIVEARQAYPEEQLLAA